jgi:hypothetical protein
MKLNVQKTDYQNFVMKTIFFHLFIISCAGTIVLTSCDREPPCETCTPVAFAGADRVITVPSDTVLLDGSASRDPDGMIVEWAWTKISGPASSNIVSRTTAKTIVTNLVIGTYRFELMVTDETRLSSRDTIVVTLKPALTRWTKLTTFSEGAGQTIILGIDEENVFIGESNSKGFWKYDSETNGFIKKSDILSKACCGMLSFSVNGQGFAGMGLVRGQTFDNNEMYQYDPVVSQWTVKNYAPIAGFATPFVINGSVYLLKGRSVWMYDPNNDSYVQKNDFPGNPSYILSSSFVINGIGYYVSGADCWEYYPGTDSWQQKASLPGYLDVQAAFSLDNYGYILADSSHTSLSSDTPLQLWQYFPLNNRWIRVYDDYPGEGTSQVKTASLNGVAYVGFGYKKLNNIHAEDDLAGDFWKFE